MATPFRGRDPARIFTPLGRPFKKPRKIATSLSSLASNSNIHEFYFLERPQMRPKIHMGVRECTESRPPLEMNATGPTPCTYSLPSPSYSRIGGKINPRAKYDRDALPRPNHELWTLNVTSLEKAPSPSSYAVVNGLGSKSPSKKSGPAYSMRGRPAPKKIKSSTYPAPNAYDMAQSSHYISRHFPSFSIAIHDKHKKRTESSPGPAHYHPKHSFCQHNPPSFTFSGTTKL